LVVAKTYGGIAEWRGCQCSSAQPFCSAVVPDGKQMCGFCEKNYLNAEGKCRPNVTKRGA